MSHRLFKEHHCEERIEKNIKQRLMLNNKLTAAINGLQDVCTGSKIAHIYIYYFILQQYYFY